MINTAQSATMQLLLGCVVIAFVVYGMIKHGDAARWKTAPRCVFGLWGLWLVWAGIVGLNTGVLQ